MSHYADYLKECGYKEILETEDGFATYCFFGQECYIEDIYVVPESRKKDVASSMAQTIEEIARQRGCTFLSGSVNTAIKDPTRSIKVLLAYGFKFVKASEALLWFRKDL